MLTQGSLVWVSGISWLGKVNNWSHIKGCLFCLKTDCKAVKLRLHKLGRRRVEQQGNSNTVEGSRQASAWAGAAAGRLCSASCALRAEIRLGLAEGVPWPGCDPEGHWAATANEICEWKEVKMNSVRILKKYWSLERNRGKELLSHKLRKKIF